MRVDRILSLVTTELAQALLAIHEIAQNIRQTAERNIL
jgi:hypothetical protein